MNSNVFWLFEQSSFWETNSTLCLLFVTMVTTARFLPRPCVTFRNMLFLRSGIVNPLRPTPKLENHPLSAILDFLLCVICMKCMKWTHTGLISPVCRSVRMIQLENPGRIWMKFGMDFMPLEYSLKWYSASGWGETPWRGSDGGMVPRGEPLWCARRWDGRGGSTAGRKPPCEANPMDGAEPPGGQEHPRAMTRLMWCGALGVVRGRVQHGSTWDKLYVLCQFLYLNIIQNTHF
jgi:hypothetical protein